MPLLLRRPAGAQYRIERNLTSDSVDALLDPLSGYPFRSYGPRVIMVDEAQV